MNRFDHQWQQLTALARQAREVGDFTAPVGFATRLAARSVAGRPSFAPWALLERFALRGLFVATVCSVAAVAFNYFGTSAELPYDVGIDETMALLLDLS